MTTTSSKLPLIDALLPLQAATATPTRLLRATALALIGTAVLTLSAKIQVPFWPVPMTLQTFAVLMLAAAFGPRLGAATVALYLVEGALGLPVFAGTPERGIGLAYMMGPTGGYLLGFLVATVLMGSLELRGWGRHFATAVAAMALGMTVMLLCGVSWLTVLIGFEKALAVGLLPFLPGELLKVALAGALLPFLWRFARSARS